MAPQENVDVVCSICQDDEVDLVFDCKTFDCEYTLCIECLRMAFKDGSGSNSSTCPMCKQPAAIQMVEAACGTMAVKAVEKEVRSAVEFDVKNRLLVKKQQSKELEAASEEARKLFNLISEEVNLKCPCCEKAFDDYDGCNALRCSCGAAICALCFIDCGRDAHEHVRKNHPNQMFDHAAFQRATQERVQCVVDDHLARIKNKPEELIQLVKNHIDKTEMLGTKINSDIAKRRSSVFLRDAKRNLTTAVRNDRLSLVSEQRRRAQKLTRAMISPRCVVPAEYRLTLKKIGSASKYSIELKKTVLGRWVSIPLEAKDRDKDEPIVDSLSNLKPSLSCAVIAIEGEECVYQTRYQRTPAGKEGGGDDGGLSDNVVYIGFYKVKPNGNVEEESSTLNLPELIEVLGLNPNRRISLLQRHVDTATQLDLVTTSIEHLIGAGNPLPLLDEITNPLPDTLVELNEQQKSVAHPLKIKTAMEVAGPPGTGKTKTITELTRSLLGCTNFTIIVLSERNGAIDAIAEKFAQTSMSFQEDGTVSEIHDVAMWTNVMTFGSSGIGDNTKLFTLNEKLMHHPELVQLRAQNSDQWDKVYELAKQQRKLLANIVVRFGETYDVEGASIQSEVILRDKKKDLSRPTEVINYIEMIHRDLEEIVSQSASKLTEDDLESLVERYEALIGHLRVFPKRNDREQRLSPKGWNTPERVAQTMSNLETLRSNFYAALKLDSFARPKADDLTKKARALDNQLKQHEERLRVQLLLDSRLKMCTIGSSHRLCPDEEKEKDVADHMVDLEIDDGTLHAAQSSAVVIFDEAGCIPSYELLGLSRLGYKILSLVVVGDVHQLPPYDPGSGNFKPGQRQQRQVEKVQSILDVSSLSQSKAKVTLTTQYRVPRDIAELLKHRIYQGKYETAESAKVPPKGFHFVHVPYVENKKYVNENEIEIALELVERAQREGYTSIHILTPYKKQQREIQFRLRDRFGSGPVAKKQVKQKLPATVLTIDQCQGQEADIVILSLVRKPTRFLNKNRLNVALSRVREKLYLLVDREQFLRASNDSGWECNLLARDLLSM